MLFGLAAVCNKIVQRQHLILRVQLLSDASVCCRGSSWLDACWAMYSCNVGVMPGDKKADNQTQIQMDQMDYVRQHE